MKINRIAVEFIIIGLGIIASCYYWDYAKPGSTGFFSSEHFKTAGLCLVILGFLEMRRKTGQ